MKKVFLVIAVILMTSPLLAKDNHRGHGYRPRNPHFNHHRDYSRDGHCRPYYYGDRCYPHRYHYRPAPPRRGFGAGNDRFFFFWGK